MSIQVSLLTTVLTQSHKLHLGQIGDYPLFVQVGIGDPILSNSNSSVIFLSFPLNFLKKLTHRFFIIKKLKFKINIVGVNFLNKI